jgi:TRAP-type C4-dicarboxylate transport system permease small subunit
MITALITVLIYLLVLGVLWWAIDYAISAIPIPDPPARFIRIIMVVVFALIFVSLLLSLIGVGGLDLPRLR